MSLLKQKDLKDERESFAATWTVELYSLLTQLKLQLSKNSLKLRILLTVLLIVQSGMVGEEDKERKKGKKEEAISLVSLNDYAWPFFNLSKVDNNILKFKYNQNSNQIQISF